MKIIELHGENIKKLKAVRFKPNAGITVISGGNGNGKTSVLDVIWLALKGKEASAQNPEVIRHGEENAIAELDLGEYQVIRKFNAGSSTLDVRNKDGAKFPSPQAMLDKLIGSISLDPLAFLGYESDKQRKLMLSFTDLTSALSKKDADIKRVYDERALVNRQLEKEMAILKQLEGVEIPDEVVEKREFIVLDSVRKELKDAMTYNDELNVNRAKRNTISNDIGIIEMDIERLQAKLSGLKKLFDKMQGIGDAVLQNTDSILDRLRKAEENNNHLKTLEQYEYQKSACEDMHYESTKLTEELDSLRTERMDAIKNAKYPLDGLGINDDGITYQGIPFIQLSGAEKLRVSISMAIALNPKLRVIRITDGSLLDSKSMAVIEAMAGEHDMQVFIERVDESGKVGIVIEDGEIASNNYEEPIPQIKKGKKK